LEKLEKNLQDGRKEIVHLYNEYTNFIEDTADKEKVMDVIVVEQDREIQHLQQGIVDLQAQLVNLGGVPEQLSVAKMAALTRWVALTG
jgi:hypothetical protein